METDFILNLGRKRSPALSILIFVLATASMVWLRLGLFPHEVVALTYGLPLLICLWHQDRRLLWAMSAAFLAIASIKFIWFLPDSDPRDRLELTQWLMQVLNILVIAGTVNAVIHLTGRVQRKRAQLQKANKELSARQEEITRQNEELQAQAEELARQNEEILQQTEELQQQTEELTQQNEELEQQSEELQAQSGDLQATNKELNERELMLQVLLGSLRGANTEPELLQRICDTLIRLTSPYSVAAAVVERSGEHLVVRTHAGPATLRQYQWPFPKSFASVVLAHGRTGYVDDLAARPDLVTPQPENSSFRSVLATPLKVGSACTGAIELFTSEPRKWSEQEFQIIEWVAEQSGRVLETLRLQRELHQNEAQLRTIVESMTEGLVVIGLNGKTLYWNATALAMHGLSRPEPTDGSIDAYAQRFELLTLEGKAVRFEQSPLSRALRGERFNDVQLRIQVEKEGPQRIFSYGGSLARDPQGQAVLAIVTISDITERKQAELRTDLLAEAASRLLISKSPQAVVERLCTQALRALDLDLFFNFLVQEEKNRLHLNAYGGIPTEVARTIEWLDYGSAVCACAAREGCRIVSENIPQHPEDRTALVASMGVLAYACHPLKAGARVLGTLSFGSRRRLRFREQELNLMQAVTDLVAIAIERQQAQEELRRANSKLEQRVAERTARLQEAMDELEHFSYTITHDMRAPLRAMQGFAGLMAELCGEDLDQEQRDCLRHIATSAARMDRLITDALSYSRTVKQEFHLAPTDPAALLRGMIASYPAFQPPKADIRIREPLPTVLANEAGLTQCFSNLLGNAVKFVPPGIVPRVYIGSEQKNGLVRIWVQDNGIGIPREAHGKLFTMFQRACKDYEGTGIGLALVKKVVERMHGRVGLESEPGKGSRFWIELRPAEALAFGNGNESSETFRA